jgi:Asp-tRNA(Asn)/Glu-tRNA(Gln) amidotransferase A subunit family amidase
MARSATDLALMMDVMAGYDPTLPASGRGKRPPNYEAELARGVAGLRVGVPSSWFYDLCDSEVQKANQASLDLLRSLGAEIIDVDLEYCYLAETIAPLILFAENAAAYRAYLNRLDSVDGFLANTIVNTMFVESLDVAQALRARVLMQRDFERVFAAVDAVAMPSTIAAAPFMDTLDLSVNGDSHPFLSVARTTAFANAVGLPALSIPCGFNQSGLPLGLQIVARPYDDAICLRVGHTLEQLTPHSRAVPPLIDRLNAGEMVAKRQRQPPTEGLFRYASAPEAEGS